MGKFLLALLLSFNLATAQNIDSLKQLLATTKRDTTRIGLYIKLAEAAGDSTALLYSDTAQNLIKAQLDKANGKLKTALYTYLSDAIYYRALHHANTEKYDSAIFYFHAALAPALSAKNRLQEAQILNDIGVCSYYKSDIAATIAYQKKSLAIREELNDEAQLRNAYNNMAFIYKETGLVDLSLDLNFKALKLAEKINNESDISTSLNNIGQVYHKYLLDYDKGLEYYTKSLALREKLGNKKDIGLIKNNLASLYADRGNYKEAIHNYQESLELRKAANHKYGVVQTLSNLAYNYFKLKDFVKAQAFLAESMALNKTLQDKILQEAIHYNYAELYNALKRPDSAIHHARLSHAINLEFGNPLDISESARLLSSLYENEGQYETSLSYYKLYKKMQDSIVNDNLKKAGIKKEMEYEYLKKKTESDKLYNQQIARKNLSTWILALLLIAASAIAAILLNRYKLKQRLKEVEMRNKIASDLHDDVGSTLSSIRMYSGLVKNQPNQTPMAAELLERISSNSKEMIENMGDIVWMIKPGNDNFKNVENKMLNFANELCVPAGINFELANDRPSETLRLPMEQRRDLYLIFKEALNNAVKYSGCRYIHTAVSLKGKELTMTIRDDGTGFDTARLSNGNGLLNMQKRAESHGGTFRLTSTSEGTEIVVLFPV